MRRLALVIAGCVSVVAAEARAGGFEIPETGARALSRGGAFSVLADDLTAIALNPGAMTRLPGTRFFLSYTLMHAPLTFERSPTLMPDFENESPPPITENEEPIFPLGIFIGLSSDFGLEDWRFWVAVYGPNSAGTASFDPESAARYQLTDLDLKLLYYTAGVAWGKKDQFGIGASIQWAHAPSAKFELMVDGATGGDLNAYTSTFDVLAQFDLADPGQLTMIIGGWWRVIPSLELGLSGRVVPVYLNMEGTVKLTGKGELFQNGGTLVQTGDGASISAVIPPTVHAGIRYRHLEEAEEIFDIELDVVYEAWSMLDAYQVDVQAHVTADVVGAKIDDDVPPLTVEKQWKDTISVRLGGTWNIMPQHLAVSAGGFWESATAPDDYAYVDFSAYERFGLGGGFRFMFTGVDITLSYLHVFQADVTVDENTAKVFQQRPLSQCPDDCGGASGVAANAGTFKSSFDQLGLSVGLHFDEWMD